MFTGSLGKLPTLALCSRHPDSVVAGLAGAGESTDPLGFHPVLTPLAAVPLLRGAIGEASVAVPGRPPSGPFEIVERPIPEPGAGSVRIKVARVRHLPQRFGHQRGPVPRDSVPSGSRPRGGRGDRRGRPRRRPDGSRASASASGGTAAIAAIATPAAAEQFFACVRGQTTGVTYDGGYGEYMIAPASAVARMPAELPPVEAAP